MLNTWFTSDSHFGHSAILEFEKEARPFATVEEMNEVMIQRWNEVVNPKDTVYHLGDFCFGRHNLPIADRLNGTKRLIMGNHDHYPTAEYLKYFKRLGGVMFWHMATLSHIPISSRLLGKRSVLSVHGHLHSKVMKAKTYWGEELPDINYFNVSVEQNNLYPFHADVIRDRLKELE